MNERKEYEVLGSAPLHEDFFSAETVTFGFYCCSFAFSGQGTKGKCQIKARKTTRSGKGFSRSSKHILIVNFFSK